MQKRSVTVKNILSSGSNLKDRFIPNLKELKRVTDNLKRMGYRIVLTQGVYDMLHEGHARYLEQALSYGDVLVVGVDSDELTGSAASGASANAGTLAPCRDSNAAGRKAWPRQVN